MWLLGNSKYICGWHYISFGQCYSSLMLVIMAETIIKTLPPLGYLSPNYPRPQWIWALCTSIAPYPSILTLFHYTSIVCHSTRLQVSWGNRLDFFFLIPVYSSYSKGIKQIINVKWEYPNELLLSWYEKSQKILSLWMTAAIGSHKLYPQSFKKNQRE